MSNKKMLSLQQAISASAGKTNKPAEPTPPSSAAAQPLAEPLPPSPASDQPPAATKRSPSRQGQVNISTWMHEDFRSGLRLVQIRKGARCTLLNVMEEALNDLFTKYNVPIVRLD